MARKKNRRQQDSSDEEDKKVNVQKVQDGGDEECKKKDKKQKRKEKMAARAAAKAELEDNSTIGDEESQGEVEGDEGDFDQYAAAASMVSKKKKNKKKKKERMEVEEIEEDEEQLDEPIEEAQETIVDEHEADVENIPEEKSAPVPTPPSVDTKERKEKKDKKKKKKKGYVSNTVFEFKEEEDDEDLAELNDEVAELDISSKSKKDKGEKKPKDGKRLSNKERRKLREEREKEERDEEYHRTANPLDGSQFAVSQQSFQEDSTWKMATDIKVEDFSINAHSKILFENASLRINAGGKYGLVGPNGQGKTTLLKMIALKELKIPPNIDNLYVEQEVVADDTRAVDAVLKADRKRWKLLEEEQQVLKEIEKNKNDDALADRLNDIYEELEVQGASGAEARARKILFGLGFDSQMQEKVTKEFSGGWRMRISIAKALFMEPTLLMLDEPTNHLDLNAVIWLDDYLQKWKNTILIVSHDADFLNSVCSEIIHLNQKKLDYYKGNYDQFKEMETQKRKQTEKAWEKQQKHLRSLKASGKSSKKATEIVKKKREPGARAASKKARESVASSQSNNTTSQTLLERPREYMVKFSFPETTILSPPILEVRDVSWKYGEGPYLFKDCEFGIDTNSRICICGPNGVGKSTLLKVITDELKVIEGEVRRNPKLRMGIYNQHFVDKLPMGETPVEYLRRLFQDETYQSCRNLLGKVGLEGHGHEIKNRLLSGGQKARVVLAELILMKPHILVLDEPTNNLDIESIDALCDALNAFDGGVVIVTHDARLIAATSCVLWVVGEQKVVEYPGGFDEYRQHILDDISAQADVEEKRLQEKVEKRTAEIAAKRLARAEKLAAAAAAVQATET